MASKAGAGKPALSMGTKKAAGARMECPTCGFKWVRPPGEEHKPCPKCFKPLPKGMAAAAPKPAASPKKAASPTAAAKPKAASPAPASPPAAAAPAEAPASPAPAASSPKPVKKASTPTNSGGLGSAATVGQRMECPTCGFKWNRPAGEDNKPCPKCLKPLPKSAVKGVAKVAAKTGKPSIFDKLTDPKQYTGAHKARFDSDGKGRGIAGRY